MKEKSNIKLLIGLGNPGIEYQDTRHNLGFQVIDYLANKLNIELKKEKFKGLYTISTYLEQKVIFLKPLTYMNNSGECIRNFMNYFRISVENMLVIYDDLSLPLESFRYRSRGSSGGHNGIKNIIECLKTQKFPRLKIGIGSKQEVFWKDWVLQKFSSEEKGKVEKIFPIVIDSLLEWVKNSDFVKVMNKYN